MSLEGNIKPASKAESPERGLEDLEPSVRLAGDVINQEVEKQIPPKRKSGYMLSTVLALGMATGIFADKAEARNRYGPSLGEQVRNQISRSIKRGMNNTSAEINQKFQAKISQLGYEHSVKITELADREGRVRSEYQRGDISEAEYLNHKNEIEKARYELDEEYEKKISKIRLEQRMVRATVRGARGW